MHRSSLRTYHSFCSRPVMIILNIITSPSPEFWFQKPTDVKLPITTEAEHNYCPKHNCTQQTPPTGFLPTYLEILLPMKDNGFCLDFSVLNIHFVATQHYGDIFTYSYQISMPIRYILVSNSWCYIKHYDGTLSCKRREVKLHQE